MKKKMTSVVLAMVVAVCMFNTMRVEAASPSEVLMPLVSDTEQPEVLIGSIQTQKTDMYESGETVISYYVVTQTDVTIESIASRLQITEEYLLSANEDCRFELDGELPLLAYVRIPEIDWHVVEDVYYCVMEGDTLSKISEYFYTDIEDIQTLNPQIVDANIIYVGDIIQVR